MAVTLFPETADIETSSDDYARRFSGAVGDWFLQVQEAATLEMLAPYPEATILDVGGGHGQATAALVRCGYHLTVLGSDDSCANRIRRFVDAGQVEFRVGDILNLPFPDRSFDVVLSYRLLPHVSRWQPYLAEMARVARQAVVLDYPEARSINYITPYLFKYKKRLEGNTRPYTVFRGRELDEAFRRLGFAPAARYPEFFWPMVLHRKLKQPRLSAGLEAAARTLGLTGWLGSPVIRKWVREGGQNNENPISSSTTVF